MIAKVFLTRHGIRTMDKITLLREWHGSQLINPLVHSGTGSKTFIPYDLRALVHLNYGRVHVHVPELCPVSGVTGQLLVSSHSHE
jgi:hypothetical protein